MEAAKSNFLLKGFFKKKKKVDVAYTEIRIKIALMCVLRTNADTALSFEVKTSTFRVYFRFIGRMFYKEQLCSCNVKR